MSVKLGIAPIAWSNDDMPELGGDTTLETCLQEAKAAGFIGIESGGKFPKTSRELIPILNKFNINLCSGWYGANLLKRSVKEEMDNIRPQLDLFKDCEAPCIVFAEVTGSIQADKNIPLSKRPKLNNDEWKKYCEKISEIARRLEDENMPLAYHHHMGTVIQSQEDTERLMSETNDSVKLTIDTEIQNYSESSYDSSKALLRVASTSLPGNPNPPPTCKNISPTVQSASVSSRFPPLGWR